MSKCRVAGVAMSRFYKPGQQPGFRQMASAAVRDALADAGLSPTDIQQAYASFVYAGTTSGQHAFYDVVQSGIPVFNVNNACASGSTALFLARQAIVSGAIDCVAVLGFEEMSPGAIATSSGDMESPMARYETVLDAKGYPPGPLALRCFGAAGDAYMKKYGVNADLFAQIAVKSRRHAAHNPHALFVKPMTVDEVKDAQVVYLDYLTRLMCCPPTCGAAAAILVSDAFARKRGLEATVAIVGQGMSTDTEASWGDPISLVGAGMTQRASRAAHEQAGVGPDEMDVVELHDCFTTNEAISCEALGLCGEGEAARFVGDGDNTYGGQVVVNPSGGLMSKGHPLGATGLAQCYELTTQLRGTAGARQVENARHALQHNIGLGGAAVVTVYQAGAA